MKILNAAVNDCCIGTPVCFIDFQGRAVLDAATIAGLNSFRLLHHTTTQLDGVGFKVAIGFHNFA